MKAAWSALAGLLIALVPAPPGFAQDTNSSHDGDWSRCERNYPAAEAKLAIPACTRLIDAGYRDVGLSTAYTYRATAYSNLADFDRAFADYAQALSAAAAAPNQQALVLLNRGGAYGALLDEKKAVADFDRAIVLRPNYAAAIAARGITRSDLRKYDLALVDLDYANQLDRGFDGALKTACWIRAALLVRELDHARRDCAAAIALDPANHRYHIAAAMVAMREQRFQDAWAAYDLAKTLQPRSADARMGRGIAALRLGRTDDGQADIAVATALRPDVRKTYADLNLLP